MFELTLCQSCLWQPVQPHYWDILRSFLSWFFRKEKRHLHRLGQAKPRRGALKRAWTWHCAERDNTLCWKAQRTVLKSTTHCAEKHNTLCWKAQHTVLKSTTHCAEKHNTLCWKAQHTALKSTNSLWWQALLLVLGHCMSFCINDSCTGRKAWSWDITDWGKQCIQGQGLHTGLAQRCQKNARFFCRKGTTLTS